MKSKYLILTSLNTGTCLKYTATLIPAEMAGNKMDSESLLRATPKSVYSRSFICELRFIEYHIGCN